MNLDVIRAAMYAVSLLFLFRAWMVKRSQKWEAFQNGFAQLRHYMRFVGVSFVFIACASLYYIAAYSDGQLGFLGFVHALFVLGGAFSIWKIITFKH